MKTGVLTFLFVLLSALAHGQTPPVGIIDFYGLRSVSEQQAREALRITEGDALPESPKEALRRLEALPNVEQARLNLICCDAAGKAILYVGIREKGAPALQFRPAPQGSIRLPDSMVQTGAAFFAALTRAVQKGDTGEDDSRGHALSNNAEARAFQQRFIRFAAEDLQRLRAVLRESADAEHRALAAEIIAYAANKRAIVKDLVYAMSDADEAVRNNAMRALGVIAGFAQSVPKQRINVPVQPFVAMLNSLVWTDRNKSAAALNQLTQKRDPLILYRLRASALPSLIEMARWREQGHAFAPFMLLGRVGNLSEEEISNAWQSGDREAFIRAVLAKIKVK
jgi:hypothetical protein